MLLILKMGCPHVQSTWPEDEEEIAPFFPVRTLILDPWLMGTVAT